MIDLDFIRLLNQLKFLFPCSTESLDRTEIHNKNEGGAPNSFHLKGLAADLIYDDPLQLIPAARCAKDLGFGGIEVDLRNLHLHVDMRAVEWHVVVSKTGTVQLVDYLTSV